MLFCSCGGQMIRSLCFRLWICFSMVLTPKAHAMFYKTMLHGKRGKAFQTEYFGFKIGGNSGQKPPPCWNSCPNPRLHDYTCIFMSGKGLYNHAYLNLNAGILSDGKLFLSDGPGRKHEHICRCFSGNFNECLQNDRVVFDEYTVRLLCMLWKIGTDNRLPVSCHPQCPSVRCS